MPIDNYEEKSRQLSYTYPQPDRRLTAASPGQNSTRRAGQNSARGNTKAVTRLLVQRGLLLTDGSDSATRKVRLPLDGNARCYVFKPGIVGIDC